MLTSPTKVMSDRFFTERVLPDWYILTCVKNISQKKHAYGMEQTLILKSSRAFYTLND